MISNNYKTSLQVAKQLPEFVQDDNSYQTFVSFIEAYYQWMETAHSANSSNTIATSSGQGITYASKNLMDYSDVDGTMDQFVDYFINDFLPYIPTDALADKRKLLKISKELYKTKGTENSYKFLFRALFNSSAEVFNTSDTILKASDGKWVITKSLRIDSLNVDWLLINNLRLFGETTKSYATVDYASVAGSKTEVFISNIQRLFNSGEFIRVVDNNNLDVYFYQNQVYIQNSGVIIPPGASILRGKIVGVISSVKINTKNRGQFYVTGDPVIITGGLNPDVVNPVGATATVGETTTGSITSIKVLNGSNGYQLPPNSSISFSGGGSGFASAEASINLLDENNLTTVSYIVNNSLGIAANVVMGNTITPELYNCFKDPGVSNTNTRLIDAFNFTSFTVGPIGSIRLINEGAGYSSTPNVTASSFYSTDVGQSELKTLGVLQPIQVVNGGTGYGNNDIVHIVGGVGEGAYAKLTVNNTGSIVHVDYIFADDNTNPTYPLGGCGYTANDPPKIEIDTTYGENASLVIRGVMGDGAVLSPSSDRIGQISSITITNPGEDYVSTPIVYLNIQDLTFSNVSGTNSITTNDIIYQGDSITTATYTSVINSFVKLNSDSTGNTQNDVYSVRVYDYIGSFDDSLPLHIDKISGENITQLSFEPKRSLVNKAGLSTSMIKYGDGNAKANATFLDGLIVGQGVYLNEDGQPSSLGLVLQSLNYNKFTYVLSVEKALKTYKNLVLNLLHPSGSKLIGRNLLRSSDSFNMGSDTSRQTGRHLHSVTDYGSYATLSIDTTDTKISTNTIQINNVASTNIGNTIFVGDSIYFNATNNVKVFSTITNVDYDNNQLTLLDDVFLTFNNVAFGYSNAFSNLINITSVTGQYDGNFGELQNKTPANSIIYVGDTVSLNAGPYYKVTNVYANGNISVNNSSFGPTENSLITVNKNANTQSVMLYGLVKLY